MKNILKKYKGVFFKKNGYFDYTEIHKFVYGMVKSIPIFRPSKLSSNLNALHMDFNQWEDSEGQYSDIGLISTYTTKMALISHYMPELIQLIKVVL